MIEEWPNVSVFLFTETSTGFGRRLLEFEIVLRPARQHKWYNLQWIRGISEKKFRHSVAISQNPGKIYYNNESQNRPTIKPNALKQAQKKGHTVIIRIES